MSKINCVLLIEDDDVTNFVNNRIIKGLKISEKINLAHNGEEAFNFVKNFAMLNDNSGPELILLDLNMPVADGFEFIHAFKELRLSNSEKIKIIVLTTSSHEEDISKIIKDKNIGYINKPLTEDKLLSVLWKDYKIKDKKPLAKP
jgi:response regulator of citrate/malate metabolism